MNAQYAVYGNAINPHSLRVVRDAENNGFVHLSSLEGGEGENSFISSLLYNAEYKKIIVLLSISDKKDNGDKINFPDINVKISQNKVVKTGQLQGMRGSSFLEIRRDAAPNEFDALRAALLKKPRLDRREARREDDKAEKPYKVFFIPQLQPTLKAAVEKNKSGWRPIGDIREVFHADSTVMEMPERQNVKAERKTPEVKPEAPMGWKLKMASLLLGAAINYLSRTMATWAFSKAATLTTGILTLGGVPADVASTVAGAFVGIAAGLAGSWLAAYVYQTAKNALFGENVSARKAARTGAFFGALGSAGYELATSDVGRSALGRAGEAVFNAIGQENMNRVRNWWSTAASATARYFSLRPETAVVDAKIDPLKTAPAIVVPAVDTAASVSPPLEISPESSPATATLSPAAESAFVDAKTRMNVGAYLGEHCLSIQQLKSAVDGMKWEYGQKLLAMSEEKGGLTPRALFVLLHGVSGHDKSFAEVCGDLAEKMNAQAPNGAESSGIRHLLKDAILGAKKAASPCHLSPA